MGLVGTMILGLPLQSYADPQLDTLLRIATQARDNLSIAISQINNVPNEINQLYKQGSDETDELSKAVDQQDVESAKQHFLAAMKFFKVTNDKINSLNATASNDQQGAAIIQLRGEIIRLDRRASLLKTIASTNNIDVDFTKFDELIQTAQQDIDASNIGGATTAVKSANDFLVETHRSLAVAAQEKISERAKDFTEKQIERFSKMSELNPPQTPVPLTTVQPTNATPPPTMAPSTTAPSTNVTVKAVTPVQNYSNIVTAQNPAEMLAELKKLVSEGKVSEALKIIKTLEAYQREKLRTAEKAEQLPPSAVTPNAIGNLTNKTSTNPSAVPVNTTAINATNSTTKNGTELNSSAVQSVPVPNLPRENNSTSANKTDSLRVAVPGLGSGHGDHEKHYQEKIKHDKVQREGDDHQNSDSGQGQDRFNTP
jgi:hypothetical protein